MAVRTATASDLDTKISALLTSLDSYLAVATPSGEDKQVAARYAWRILLHKLRQRAKMKRLIDSGPVPRPVHKNEAATPTLELDPFA